MNEQELRSLVERMVLELAGQPNAAAPAKAAPAPASSSTMRSTRERSSCSFILSPQ